MSYDQHCDYAGRPTQSRSLSSLRNFLKSLRCLRTASRVVDAPGCCTTVRTAASMRQRAEKENGACGEAVQGLIWTNLERRSRLRGL